jgi:hypothetical protein
MEKHNTFVLKPLLLTISAGLFLTACGGGGDNDLSTNRSLAESVNTQSVTQMQITGKDIPSEIDLSNVASPDIEVLSERTLTAEGYQTEPKKHNIRTGV